MVSCVCKRHNAKLGKIPKRRIIVKKLVSLFIALMLVVSLFTVTTVAFAGEEGEPSTPATPVTFNEEAFKAISANNPVLVQGVSSEFSLDTSWLKDAAKVNAVFAGANYVLDESEGHEDYALANGSDTVKLQYLRPSNDYKDDAKWTSTTKVNSTINVSTTGWWGFRYILKQNGSSEAYAAKSSVIYIYFSDDSAPKVTGLSTDMKKVQQEGIKVGSTYSIRTNLTISDTSSTTVTYKVFKKVNGSWTEQPIYDSATREVAEGYEKNISTSGVITMQESDVTADKSPVYKIVYSVKDAMGYVTDGTEMTIFATKEAQTVSTNQIIQYVLFGVAGLSAIGILVVVFVKPKKKVETPDDSSAK